MGLTLPWLSSCQTSTDTITSTSPEGQTQTNPVCDVINIHDGDTMRVSCGGEVVRVRLNCIDAPELAQRPWGTASRDYLRQITPARVAIQSLSTDRYGRTIAEVYAPQDQRRSLNLQLVSAGQAVVYGKYCKSPVYRGVERRAQEAAVGLWRQPGLHQEPWAYRAAKRS
ncbi:thermonuclease family protein [Granulosicoccaceae sp. 1_MG-2023]|nr:thermonuclease family protein [Granulosicoccaceae sp. 1_MG-2023]